MTRLLKIALLILTTYDIHPSIKEYISKTDIPTYIHPKYVKELDTKFKKYIISDLHKTKWGDISIIHATIALIKQSITTNIDYLVLISGDTLLNPDFEESLNKINYPVTKSIFSDIIEIPNNNNTMKIYKTSQWWCLSKADACIILASYKKYMRFFTKKYHCGADAFGGGGACGGACGAAYGAAFGAAFGAAPDELFFLSLLMNETAGNKKWPGVIIHNTIYSRWISKTVKHPTTFNILTRYDINNYKKTALIGLRKCTQNCIATPLQKLKKNVYICIVGTYTNQQKILEKINFAEWSLIILTPLEIIMPELKTKAMTITFFYYGEMEIFITSYFKLMEKYLNQWHTKIFAPEDYFN